jgi:hypothetical protein
MDLGGENQSAAVSLIFGDPVLQLIEPEAQVYRKLSLSFLGRTDCLLPAYSELEEKIFLSFEPRFEILSLDRIHHHACGV